MAYCYVRSTGKIHWNFVLQRLKYVICRHEEAEDMYKRALELDPCHVNTLCSYGAFMVLFSRHQRQLTCPDSTLSRTILMRRRPCTSRH
eukprot:746168-Hanusia_phi.AAC.5